MIITNTWQIREYVTTAGLNPYRSWLESLPVEISTRIQARILRLEQGNLGDYKAVGHGVFELRLFFGPGYRVYFAFEGKTVVLLLGGGNKSSQRKDTIAARLRWIEYRGRYATKNR